MLFLPADHVNSLSWSIDSKEAGYMHQASSVGILDL